MFQSPLILCPTFPFPASSTSIDNAHTVRLQPRPPHDLLQSLDQSGTMAMNVLSLTTHNLQDATVYMVSQHLWLNQGLQFKPARIYSGLAKGDPCLFVTHSRQQPRRTSLATNFSSLSLPLPDVIATDVMAVKPKDILV